MTDYTEIPSSRSRSGSRMLFPACFLAARRTFSDKLASRTRRAGLIRRRRRPYTYLRAYRLRSMRLTVPAAINFTRPRGTPIHARSLQLPIVVSSILLTRKCRNTHTRTSICARETPKEKEKKKKEEEKPRALTRMRALAFCSRVKRMFTSESA